MKKVYKYVSTQGKMACLFFVLLGIAGVIYDASYLNWMKLGFFCSISIIVMYSLNQIGKQNAEIRTLKSQIEKLNLENKKLMHPLYDND